MFDDCALTKRAERGCPLDRPRHSVDPYLEVIGYVSPDLSGLSRLGSSPIPGSAQPRRRRGPSLRAEPPGGALIAWGRKDAEHARPNPRRRFPSASTCEADGNHWRQGHLPHSTT